MHLNLKSIKIILKTVFILPLCVAYFSRTLDIDTLQEDLDKIIEE